MLAEKLRGSKSNDQGGLGSSMVRSKIRREVMDQLKNYSRSGFFLPGGYELDMGCRRY